MIRQFKVVEDTDKDKFEDQLEFLTNVRRWVVVGYSTRHLGVHSALLTREVQD